MKMVLLTALGVGGATVFGSVLGFLFKKISHRFSDIVLAFAAGVMLCAAVTGLILPSLEYEATVPLLLPILGIFCGGGSLWTQYGCLSGGVWRRPREWCEYDNDFAYVGRFNGSVALSFDGGNSGRSVCGIIKKQN